jgi:MoCo/4Fe-4S cofactor protein with predicted Tat translocation signal
MSNNNKKYWTSLEEFNNRESFQEAVSQEFAPSTNGLSAFADENLSKANTGRRDFLKFMGFSVAAATLAACETPVVKSIPYVVKPEDITPGIANYYATTYYDGVDYANLLVKTREGRPIFIKGNKSHGLGHGAVNARVNGSVLEIYDEERLKGARKNGADISWESLDKEMMAALSAAKNVRIISNTIISSTTKNAIAALSNANAGKVKHVQYDVVSYNGLTMAHNEAFGKSVVPQYHFDKAKVIVSVGADFLGSWLTANIFATDYAAGRRPEAGSMSKHYQFESNMSLTGSNADVRVPVKPSQEGKVIAALYDALNGKTTAVEGVDAAVISKLAKELKAAAGASLVVAGSNDANVQRVVVAINKMLSNYGATINMNEHLNLFAGNDAEVAGLVAEMNSGIVDVLIVHGCNPCYNLAHLNFEGALSKVKTSVSTALFADETASKCTYQAPDHHQLESWDDLSAVAGRIDLVQPTINPMYNTRPSGQNYLSWSGNGMSYYDYLRLTFNAAYTPAMMDSDNNWYNAVHNGTFVSNTTVVEDPTAEIKATPVAAAAVAAVSTSSMDVTSAMSAIQAVKGGAWEMSLYTPVNIGLGNHANNPVLQETPDPITKVTWDNYVAMAPADMKEQGFNLFIGEQEDSNLVKVKANGVEIVLPAVATPGQKRGTVSIALGYGRGSNNEAIGKAAYQVDGAGEYLMENDKRTPIGKNAFTFVNKGVFAAYDVTIESMNETYPMASTQLHSTVMGRESVVKETTLAAYLKEKSAEKGKATWNIAPTIPVHADVNGDGSINAHDRVPVREMDLWADHPVENVGHRWGMTIDLSSCIGCGSCITACHTENNVPVVGKTEVKRHRDMHWMRIDRYFSSDFTTLEETKENKGLGTIAAYGDMEIPTENPQTVHMPMMCQHCNHAPCETVCPVAATTHSNEGLNNMAYNRCIGTRYCANNCPYKVRRFNWFNYVTNDRFSKFNPSQDETMRMVLNPDVTVRTRGVMEKCSMCQQRIQAGKIDAKKRGEVVGDGAIVTACAEACPTHAIVFGDLNDTNSENTSRAKNNRSYHALEEVGIQPNIYYMTKVRNIETEA